MGMPVGSLQKEDFVKNSQSVEFSRVSLPRFDILNKPCSHFSATPETSFFFDMVKAIAWLPLGPSSQAAQSENNSSC